MNNINKVNKYFLWEFRWAVIIFYTIVIAIAVFLTINTNNLNERGINSSFGGFEVGAIIFLFVSGLNSFKNNFKFMLANNVPREEFFYGGVIAFSLIAAFMSLINFILSQVIIKISTYYSLYVQLYRDYNLFAEFLWFFSFFLFAISLGWLITIIYYRSNKFMKIIISVSPAIFFILLASFNNITNYKFSGRISNFLASIMGFSNNGFSPYTAVFSLLLVSVVLFSISYLFIRKMPLKND